MPSWSASISRGKVKGSLESNVFRFLYKSVEPSVRDINLELLPGGDIQWSANVTMR